MSRFLYAWWFWCYHGSCSTVPWNWIRNEVLSNWIYAKLLVFTGRLWVHQCFWRRHSYRQLSWILSFNAFSTNGKTSEYLGFSLWVIDNIFCVFYVLYFASIFMFMIKCITRNKCICISMVFQKRVSKLTYINLI